MEEDTMDRCSALRNECWFPVCPEDCLGRASSWNAERFEVLRACIADVGAPTSRIDRAIEARDWLLERRLIELNGNRYVASRIGKRLLRPPFKAR